MWLRIWSWIPISDQIYHNRYDLVPLGWWIFEIRYLRDYWELWTPVTHALDSHAETFISGPEEWINISERDSAYLKTKLRFGSPICKLSWTKDNVGLCSKQSHQSSKHRMICCISQFLSKRGALLRLAIHPLVSVLWAHNHLELVAIPRPSHCFGGRRGVADSPFQEKQYHSKALPTFLFYNYYRSSVSL